MKVNEIITARLIESIKTTGVVPWQRPWRVFGFRNAVSKKHYRGVNVLMLMALGHGNWYMTPNQIFKHGGRIKAGSKTVPICFWDVKKEERDAYGTVTQKARWILKYYNVLALEDTENVKIKLPEDKKLDFVPLDEAERLVATSGATLRHGGDRACYSLASHEITLPHKAHFNSVEEYYGTLFHELTHWIGGELKKLDASSFGSDSYSKEELVAEIGANFFANYCGVDISKTHKNSAAYIANWLSKLEADPKLIISAAAQAQARFDWLMAKLNPTTETETVGENGQEPTQEEEKNALVSA